MLFSIVVVLVKVPTNRVGSFFSTPSPAFIVVVQSLSHVWHFATPWTVACRFLCPSLSPRVFSDLCPLSRWCCLTISSSAALFSFHLQSFLASGSFPMSHLFPLGNQSILQLQLKELQHQSFQWIVRVDFFKIDCFDLLAVQGTLKSPL